MFLNPGQFNPFGDAAPNVETRNMIRLSARQKSGRAGFAEVEARQAFLAAKDAN